MTDENIARCHPIQEDMRFQRITWVAQRVSWVLMLGVIVAAMLGAFGGPESRVAVTDPTGKLKVTYERRIRHEAPAQIRIDVQSGTKSVAVQFNDEIFDHLDIQSIAPEPRQTSLDPNGPIFTFDISGAQTDAMTIHIIVVPHIVGPIDGAIGIAGETPVPTPIFVVP